MVLRDEVQERTQESDAAHIRADITQRQRDEFEDQCEQLELERNHYWDDRDRLHDQNAALRAQLQAVIAQLADAQAELVIPPMNTAPLPSLPPLPPLYLQSWQASLWRECDENPSKSVSG